MTLIELQNILGETIDQVRDDKVNPKERVRILENADTVSRVAKQMINNADVILRTDKLIAEGKLQQGAIKDVVGRK